MKHILATLIFSCSIPAFAQSKVEHLDYNKLIDIKGTEYVAATANKWTKTANSGEYLLFINTLTGESRLGDIPRNGDVQRIEQVKVDSLDINVLVVAARTVDFDEKSGIDWNDPKQILVFSPDGKRKVQVTDNDFFASEYIANHSTGRLVITGRYDTNGNHKLDKHDENKVIIYDLRKMEVVLKF